MSQTFTREIRDAATAAAAAAVKGERENGLARSCENPSDKLLLPAGGETLAAAAAVRFAYDYNIIKRTLQYVYISSFTRVSVIIVITIIMIIIITQVSGARAPGGRLRCTI